MLRPSNIARIVALVVLAAAAAAVSNLVASTERKLAWVGSYPRALDVSAPAAGVPTPTAGVAVSPAAAPTAAASPETPPAMPAASAELPAPVAPDVAKAYPPHPDRPSVEVAFSDVDLLYRRKALFLDARRSSVYAEGHIAGARSVPVWESDVDARVKALYEEGLDQRAPIVVYCSGGNCEDSHMLAEKLYMVGFDNVLIYKDGFPDWEKRGLPVARGARP